MPCLAKISIFVHVIQNLVLSYRYLVNTLPKKLQVFTFFMNSSKKTDMLFTKLVNTS